MPGRNHLFVPGPTNVPERVLRAMDRAMVDHRSSAFPELTASVLPRLREVFGTRDGQPLVFSATGTGMWEAAITNTCSPGDRLLGIRYGQFSHLFAECAQRLGMQVEMIDVAWGEGAPAERIHDVLAADRGHAIQGVLTVHHETSTGVRSDIAAVRRAMDDANHPALLFVDGVSSIGSLEFNMDEWGVDLAIAGSQKGFMLPPGLGIVCASPRALSYADQARSPRYYFDFANMLKSNASGYFPYTPPVSLMYGLRESLDMLLDEGMPAVAARHRRLADGVRAAVRAWRLDLCARAERWYSDTVSAIMVPADIDAARVTDVAFRRYDLALGGGLGRMQGRLFRIGHLGDLNAVMLLGALAGAEMAMRDVGIGVEPGSGVAAASELYRQSAGGDPKAERAAEPTEQPASTTSATRGRRSRA